MKTFVHFLLLFIITASILTVGSPGCTEGKCAWCMDDGCFMCIGGITPTQGADGKYACTGSVVSGCELATREGCFQCKTTHGSNSSTQLCDPNVRQPESDCLQYSFSSGGDMCWICNGGKQPRAPTAVGAAGCEAVPIAQVVAGCVHYDLDGVCVRCEAGKVSASSTCSPETLETTGCLNTPCSTGMCKWEEGYFGHEVGKCGKVVAPVEPAKPAEPAKPETIKWKEAQMIRSAIMILAIMDIITF